MEDHLIKVASPTNPLTTPVARDPKLTPAERAIARFALRGNAIVTGGAGGLGLEACRALLEHGLSGLCIFDTADAYNRTSSTGTGSVSTALDVLASDFPTRTIIRSIVDVRDEPGVRKAVEDAAAALGSVDHLLCFAGVAAGGRSTDFDVEEWKRVIDINLTGSWLCAQAVANQMIKQNTGGNVVLVASVAGQRALFPFPTVAYCTSKAGVKHMASCLAGEWGQYGIRVNSISPGYINTTMIQGAGRVAMEASLERTPLGRVGEPEELAGAVVLFCSDAGRYITGVDLVVSGGSHIFL